MPVPAGGDSVIAPDRLATVEDLMKMPGTPADLDEDSAGLLLEVATAVVQSACGGQRILEVVDDTVTLYGGTESLLRLPQQPVTSITSVTYGGVVLGAGTWWPASSGIYRDCGWCAYPYQQPTPTVVVYTHGYPEGDQRLQLARSAVLSLARGVAINPTGMTRMAIDDYQEAYDRAAASLDASTALAAALRKQYGRRAGTVRIA
jgi:hypothetical protein